MFNQSSQKVQNYVEVGGRLCASPKFESDVLGSKVARFTLAENAVAVSAAGQDVKELRWHRVIAWSRLATAAQMNLVKGQKVVVGGWIWKKNWTDRKGRQRCSSVLVATDIQVQYR